MADSAEKSHRLVDKLAMECKVVGLRIFIGKTETMIVNKKEDEMKIQHTEKVSKASKNIQVSGQSG
jgi:hypothetical protein